MDQTLARNYVEFVAKGLDQVQQQTDAYRDKASQAGKAADEMRKNVENSAPRKAADQVSSFAATVGRAREQFQKFSEGILRGAQIVAGPATMAFAAMSATLGGFTRAGLQGTVQGERLTWAFQQLSREVAGIFLPIVERVTRAVQGFAASLRRLTGDQQDNILKWVTAGGAVLFVAGVFPKLLGALIPVIGGVISLTAAFLGLDVASGGILPIVGAIATAVVALAAGTAVLVGHTEQGSAAFRLLGDGLSRLKDQILPPLEKIWGAVQRNIESFARVVGRLAQGAMELFSAFAQRVTVPILDKLATYLDKVSVFVEQKVVPAILLMADAFEAYVIPVIAKAIDKVVALIEFMMKFSPLARLIGAAFDGMPGSGDQPDRKGGKNHRAPANAGGGFEDAISTWKRIQSAGMKTAAEKLQEDANKELAESKRIQEQIRKELEQQNKERASAGAAGIGRRVGNFAAGGVLGAMGGGLAAYAQGLIHSKPE